MPYSSCSAITPFGDLLILDASEREADMLYGRLLMDLGADCHFATRSSFFDARLERRGRSHCWGAVVCALSLVDLSGAALIEALGDLLGEVPTLFLSSTPTWPSEWDQLARPGAIVDKLDAMRPRVMLDELLRLRGPLPQPSGQGSAACGQPERLIGRPKDQRTQHRGTSPGLARCPGPTPRLRADRGSR